MARLPTRKSEKTRTPLKTSDSLGAFVFTKLRRLIDLEQVLYIRYPTTLREKFVSALLNSESEVNAIHPIFAKELGLWVRPGTLWDIFRCRSAKNRRHNTRHLWNDIYNLLADGQGKSSQIQWMTFLLANVSPKVVFGMLFLTLTGANVNSYSLNGVCIQKRRWWL